MLQRKLASCVVLMAATALASGQNTASPAPPQGNLQNPNTQTTARVAPGSIPQQQPAWRPGQPVQQKPSPQVIQSPAQTSTAAPATGASNALPYASNQPKAIAPATSASQPLSEPITGASIARPGAVNQTRPAVMQPVVANNAGIARPVNAAVPAPIAGGMPAAQPLMGSAGRAGVEYSQGMLTVVAENAELGKLMRLIGNKTGAQIDVAADVANELVMAHLGPANPGAVLSALLDSSHLTYIMIGEDKVSKVMIRRRYSMTPPPVVARHRNLGFPQPGAEAQSTETQPDAPQETAAQSSGEIRPAGETQPPAIPSRSPLMRSGSSQPVLPEHETDPGAPIPTVDVRGQVGGTEAPDQPQSNPPQL